MTQRMVPAVPTPLLLEDAVQGFADAWPRALTAPCSPEALSVLVAQSALETGNWSMDQTAGTPKDPPTLFNYNMGNTRPAVGEDCDVCQYPGNEIIGGKVVRFKPPDPLSTFRSFPTLADGCAAQLTFLARPTSRYAQAWLRLLAGDPAGFVQQLKDHGYFTGSEAPYEKAVSSIFLRVLPIARRVLEGEHHGVTDEDRAHVAELVALTLSESTRDTQPPDTDPIPPNEVEGAPV